MSCVELIKENIVAVQKESANNQKSISLERKMDNFLDVILIIQKDLKSLNNSASELYELIHSFFPKMTVDDYLQIKDLYKELIKNLLLSYICYRKSDFYSEIKSELKIFKNNIDDLKEMGNDMHVFIYSLPQNKDYRELMKQINNL